LCCPSLEILDAKLEILHWRIREVGDIPGAARGELEVDENIGGQDELAAHFLEKHSLAGIRFSEMERSEGSA